MPTLHRLFAIGSLALALAACSPTDNAAADKTLRLAFWGATTTLVSVDPSRFADTSAEPRPRVMLRPATVV